jgi:hypothetical protein
MDSSSFLGTLYIFALRLPLFKYSLTPVRLSGFRVEFATTGK